MKKYLNTMKMVILEKIQYIPNQLLKIISYTIYIFIFFELWNYMYTDSSLIAGYTFKQMVWYVAITEIVWGAIRPKIIKTEVSKEIRSGKIAYILSKPFNYINYLMSKYIGETIVNLFTFGTSGILISLIIAGSLPTFTWNSIIFITITTILSILITGYIYMLISLTAFFIEETTPFFWIYERLILCIGVMFPIEIFPKFFQPFIKFSPVYVTMYAPAKMFVDFSINAFLEILLFQLIYLFITVILSFLIYKKGVKKLHVNGG